MNNIATGKLVCIIRAFVWTCGSEVDIRLPILDLFTNNLPFFDAL